jgi:hypothetical protein
MTAEEMEALVLLGAKLGWAFDAAVTKAATQAGANATPSIGHSLVSKALISSGGAAMPWQPSNFYPRGAVVVFKGARYRCVQDHGGWRPDERGNVWTRER